MGYTLLSNREVIATAQCDGCESMTCDCILDLMRMGRRYPLPQVVNSKGRPMWTLKPVRGSDDGE